MRHGNSSFLRRVFELLVAAALIDLVPTIALELLDDFAAIHAPSYL
jgi:hypothetical protein